MHRDIHPGNILLHQDNTGSWFAKLSNLGSAILIRSKEGVKSSSKYGRHNNSVGIGNRERANKFRPIRATEPVGRLGEVYCYVNCEYAIDFFADYKLGLFLSG